MDQKILVLAGKKQSGKSSAANFIVGYVLSQLGRKEYPFCPTHFAIDKDGKLLVNTIISDAENKSTSAVGILDLDRKDDEFLMWSMNVMWPHIKVYNFADKLKEIAVTLFNISENLVYGSEADKREPTHIKWKDMCQFLTPHKVSELKSLERYNKKMNVREFLQYFGTNLCRNLYDECWVQCCLKQIMIDGPEIAIIADARFRNEITIPSKIGAKVIKFAKSFDKDNHESEKELDRVPLSCFDLIIDNSFMTIREKNQEVLNALYQWGWLSSHVELEVQ